MDKSKFLRGGGEWLGAVRSWIQWNCINGSSVVWGSSDVLNPPLTVAKLEEAAGEAVFAALKAIEGVQKQSGEAPRQQLKQAIALLDRCSGMLADGGLKMDINCFIIQATARV